MSNEDVLSDDAARLLIAAGKTQELILGYLPLATKCVRSFLKSKDNRRHADDLEGEANLKLCECVSSSSFASAKSPSAYVRICIQNALTKWLTSRGEIDESETQVTQSDNTGISFSTSSDEEVPWSLEQVGEHERLAPGCTYRAGKGRTRAPMVKRPCGEGYDAECLWTEILVKDCRGDATNKAIVRAMVELHDTAADGTPIPPADETVAERLGLTPREVKTRRELVEARMRKRLGMKKPKKRRKTHKESVDESKPSGTSDQESTGSNSVCALGPEPLAIVGSEVGAECVLAPV